MNANIIMGILFAIMLLIYFNYYDKKEKEKDDNLYNDKKNMVRPSVDDISEYENIVNFLFDYQELYELSPANYEGVVGSLKDFVKIYENSVVSDDNLETNYESMNVLKKHAMNSLQNIIYSAHVTKNRFYENKINKGLDELDDILSYYIGVVYARSVDKLKKNGYNNKSKIIYPDEYPKPNNYYSQEEMF